MMAMYIGHIMSDKPGEQNPWKPLCNKGVTICKNNPIKCRSVTLVRMASQQTQWSRALWDSPSSAEISSLCSMCLKEKCRLFVDLSDFGRNIWVVHPGQFAQ